MMQSSNVTSEGEIQTLEFTKTDVEESTENYQLQVQNLMKDLFIDINLGTVANFFMQNQVIINPTAIKQILHTIGNYDSNHQGVFLGQLKELLIMIQTNSTLLAQKNDRGGNMKTKDIFDQLIELVIDQQRCGKEEQKREFLALISIMMKYNNISKQHLQNLFGIVSQNFHTGVVDGDLVSTSLDILHSIFSYQVPLTSEPHTFFYFNGLRSGIEVVNSHWCFQKDQVLLNLLQFQHDFRVLLFVSGCIFRCLIRIRIQSLNNHQYMYNVIKRNLNFMLMKRMIYITSVLISKKRKNQYLLQNLMLCIVKKVHFVTDQYVVNVLLDSEKISGIIIDFPKIKASTILDKMAFFRSFIGRCQSILIFRGGSPESDNINNYVPLYKNYKFGIETEGQLADLCKNIGSLFTKKELFYLPIRSHSKYVYEICYKDYGILGANSGVFCKESNFMPFQHFCGLQNIIPYFYLMKFCSSKKRQEILNLTFSLINILFKNEKFKCQEEAQNLNFFLVISQLMNETGLKLMSKQTIEYIAEIRQNVSCNLKQDIKKLLSLLFYFQRNNHK